MIFDWLESKTRKALAARFRSKLLKRRDLALQSKQHDNFDAGRFGEGERDKNSINDAYLQFFLRNCDSFYKAYKLLEDRQSREMFTELVLFRMLGHQHVKLRTNSKEYWSLRQEPAKYLVGPSSLKSENFLGGLKHFEFSYEGSNIKCDAQVPGIAFAFYLRQYVFDRSGVQIAPQKGDVVLDLGACMGDTGLAFAARVGSAGKVYSFDFMPAHLEVIEFNNRQNSDLQQIVEVCPYAVGEKTNGISGKTGLDSDSRLRPGASLVWGSMDVSQIPMITIDDFVKRQNLSSVNFVKMDIEGYEMPALLGAAETLRRFRPNLAISIYHLEEDFFKIPEWIDSLGLGYKFYLDHYTIHLEETVLFATC